MNKRRVPALLALALLLAAQSPPPARAAGPFRSKTCLECHADQKKAAGAPHAHAPFATALACQGQGIPAFHYMVARFGGSEVRCAAYVTFGTQELSDAIIAALDKLDLKFPRADKASLQEFKEVRKALMEEGKG